MKRSTVISPVMLLALTAAVGAGYLPNADPFEMLSAASSAMIHSRSGHCRVSNSQSPRLGARQWLNHVFKTFCNPTDPHLAEGFCVGHFTTVLLNLHRLNQSHLDRILSFDHHQQSQNWLLNLPPPSLS